MKKGKGKIKKIAGKHLAAIIAIAVISTGAGTVYGTLQMQDPMIGNNPAENDVENTQVLLEGKGYSLDKKQKDKYDLPQQIKKKKDKEREDNEYDPFHTSTSPQTFHTTHPQHYNTQRVPTIETDLKTQSCEVGKELQFYVKAKTASGKAIPQKGIKITSDISIKGPVVDNKKQYNYSFVVPEGRNIIKITATDPSTKLSANRMFMIMGTSSTTQPTNPTNPTETGPTDPTDPSGPTQPTVKKYTVTATISTVGLVEKYGAEEEVSASISFKSKKGTTRSNVLSKVMSKFENEGYLIDPSADAPQSLTVPYYITIVVPDTDPGEDPSEEPGDDPEEPTTTTGPATKEVIIDTISNEIFAEYGGEGKWVVKNKPPAKLDGNVNMTIQYIFK